MSLTGRMITAEDALGFGLISRVVSRPELLDPVRYTASGILSRGPLAVRLAKIVIQSGFETDQYTGLAIERLAQAVLYGSEDKWESPTASWNHLSGQSR